MRGASQHAATRPGARPAFSIAIALALALGSAAGPAAAAEPPGPAAVKGAEPTGTAVRRFALIIGANDGGKERVVLRYAHSDAEAMAKVLRELGGVSPQDHVLLLEPDRYGVLSGLKMMESKLKLARAHKGVRIELIFYFSGHSDEEGLLLSGQRFDYDELKAALKALPADVRIAILDSCASGALTRGKGGRRRPPFLVDASSQVRGHAYLASASVDEQAQESDRVGGSYFTHYLVSGLRGAADTSQDRRVTLNEAYHHAFHETLARTQSTLGGPQHPNYDIQLAGSGDLVLTDLRGTSALLVFDKKLQGRAWVRDARHRLVAEIDKRFGQDTRLGLEPGLYEVTWEKPQAVRQGTVSLTAGKEQAFEPETLPRVEAELAVARGGARRPAVAVPGAVPAGEAVAPGGGSSPAAAPETQPLDIKEARRLYKEQQREAKRKLKAFARAEKKRIRAERRADKIFIKQARRDGLSEDRIEAERARRRAERDARRALQRGHTTAEPAPDGPGATAAGAPGPAARPGASEAELGSSREDRLQTRAGDDGIPVAVCAFPGLSSFMGRDGAHDHRLSLNLLCAADSLDGFELSAFGAIRRGDMHGVQLAGLFNYVGGESSGMQLAGLGNLTRGMAAGVQVAGTNAAVGGFRGLQIGALGNYSRVSNHGVQIGGVGNLASGELSGVQIAGIFNFARHVRGLQLGLINISDSSDGAGLGLITYAADGLVEPTSWTSDTGFVNVGLKIGTRKLYNIFGIGYHDHDQERWSSFIHGIGGHVELDPVYLDIDLVAHWLQDRHNWGSGDLDLMTKLRITLGVRLGDQFSFYLGPTLNYLVSEVRDDASGAFVRRNAGLFDYSFYQGTFGDGGRRLLQRVWPGLVFGLQVEPQSGRLNNHGQPEAPALPPVELKPIAPPDETQNSRTST